MWHAKPDVAAFMVSAMVVVAVRVPEVPVIVTVAAPVAAVLLAVKVSTLLPVVGLAPNAAVTPLGRPDAARVTLPLNPPRPVTVMVSVALLPWVRLSVLVEGASVKLGVVVPPPSGNWMLASSDCFWVLGGIAS